MKVRKISNGLILVNGKQFLKGNIVNVTKKEFDYLKSTFPKQFEFLEDEKPKPKAQQTARNKAKAKVEQEVKYDTKG